MKKNKIKYLFLIGIGCLITSCGKKGPLEPEPVLSICNNSGMQNTLRNHERFGFFSSKLYESGTVALDNYIQLFGATPGFLIWFQQINDPFPLEKVQSFASKGISTVISLSVTSLSFSSQRNDTLLKEIANGIWDSTFTAFAVAAKQASVPVYLRFGYEMNGYWFPWGLKPAEFKLAWEKIHDIFVKNGATNVVWIFSPGVLYGTQTPVNDLFPYYPGDSLVDIIGLDGYNFGESVQYHHWQSFNEIFASSLLALRGYDKPLWISEIGCPTDSRRVDWLSDVFAFMENNPCVQVMMWFNEYKQAENEPDFRMESDSASLNAIRTWLQE